MDAAADRPEFAPPPQPGLVRAFVLAVIAHLLLMLALTWGIKWNRDSENISAEAELWSSVPQEAAPKAVEAPPPPPPPPVEKKAEVAPPPPPPVAKEPDIALEREKKKRELLARQQEEERRKLEARRKLEEQKREQIAAKKEAEERRKKEEQAKAAKAKKEQQEEAKLKALRDENMRRLQGLAGATGGPESKGSALRASGPSASYAGRIAARIKPNIVFTDVISGNPAAEVEIRVAPDGTIVGSKLIQSSGNKAWDEAVLRAIDRTGSIPRDTDGTVVPSFPIRFRPRD